MDELLLPIDINDEIEDIHPHMTEDLVIYSRDWTVQTIISQIEQGNIDLNPKFQRRNAWKDNKRVRLIESLLLKYPVPEIVLAEKTDKKRSYIVIDGKQRLQTLAGLYYPDKYHIWDSSIFPNSSLLPSLSKITIDDLINNQEYHDYKRMLDNSDIRCTIISNYIDENILYDIFYRLNTGSTPLSSQELRQVLNKGQFTEYLADFTSETKSIHNVLGIEKSDNRLMDIDLLLRCLGFYRNGKNYNGNQMQFLNNFVSECNTNWDKYKKSIISDIEILMTAIDFLGELIGYNKIGRKLVGDEFDWRFNKGNL